MTRVSFTLYSEYFASNRSEPTYRRRIVMENEDNVGGYAVPVDPMDLLQCDSCQ